MKNIVKMSNQDNVAIAVRDLKKGEVVLHGLQANQNIPQAHKIALVNIPKDGAIRRYGVTLGYAKNAINAGDWINEKSLDSRIVKLS